MKIYEGSIITCNEADSIAKFLVEDGGKIVFVGDELPSIYEKYDRVVLGKQALLPSFADTHIHFASFALLSSGLNISGVGSNQDLVALLKEQIPRIKTKTVLAFGASPHSVVEGRLIEKDQLDLCSVTKPIIVVSYDGHAGIINSALMNKLPVNVKCMRGYYEESGIMMQEAFYAVVDYVMSTFSTIALIKNMQKLIDIIAEKGIGMIHTVSGIGFPRDLDVDLERWIGRGAENGFQTRLFFQTMDVKKVLKRKLPRIGGCFITALDGSFGCKDAAVNEPYEGSNDKGVLFYPDEIVIDFCKKANRLGLQIELHAIGDRAFDQATRSLKAALEDFPREDHRHGIIHAFMPTKEGLEICSKYHIQFLMQTALINWKQEPASYLKKILGDRESKLHRLKDLEKLGILISLGSDAPCSIPDPILWIHNACNHPIKEQAIELTTALKMATYNGYKACFDEVERGSLEVGKQGDMVILSENPYSLEVENLNTIRVNELILGGKTYQKQKQSIVLLVLKGMLSKRKI